MGEASLLIYHGDCLEIMRDKIQDKSIDIAADRLEAVKREKTM